MWLGHQEDYHYCKPHLQDLGLDADTKTSIPWTNLFHLVNSLDFMKTIPERLRARLTLRETEDVLVPEALRKIRFIYMFDGVDWDDSPSNVFKQKFPRLVDSVFSMDILRGGDLDDILDDDAYEAYLQMEHF
jgi:hypothetical protein